MDKHVCTICQKEFEKAEALAMHTQAKHPERYKAPLLTGERKKKIRTWFFVVAVLALFSWGLYALIGSSDDTSGADVQFNVFLTPEQKALAPKGPTHWHPHLTIEIDEKFIPIPRDIGISVGKIIDTNIGGEMGMGPSHTHDDSGTLHIENLDPSKKPETLTLGYFFYVWDKTFNSTCIFEYCTGQGTLTMTVNGKDNLEFQNYLMHDGDQIKIVYVSQPAPEL